MYKKVLALLLSMVLMIGTLPMSVAAAEQSDEEKRAEKIAKDIIEQNKDRDPFDFVTKESKMVLQAEETLPRKFDLSGKFISDGDDTSYVTPVKFQNPFGTCWGFAAIAASEISLLGSGLAQERGYYAEAGPGKKELDLSEKHLVYFISTSIEDKTSSQYGEGRHSAEGTTLKDKLNGGGQPVFATSLFASGIGPNREDRDGVEPGVLEYRGFDKNGQSHVQKRKINGVLENYCYDDEYDDWSISDEYKFYQTYKLKDAVTLPTPAGGTDTTYEYNPDATKAIKTELLKKKGVTVGFHADSFSPSQEAGDGKYISKNWAHYTYDKIGANHGVCIVGWDDDYPADNFVKGHEPKDENGNMLNGAWLVKNSWGSEEREFPNKGPADWGIVDEDTGKHTGYFWLSYYDQSLDLLETFEFDESNEGTEYYLDQYDYLAAGGYLTMEQDEELKMANVFKAEVCMDIEQVTCQTTHPGTNVRSEIYLLNDDFADPTDGIPVATVNGQYPLGGYHKMQLTEPVTVQKGQYYSVVQTHIAPNGQYVMVIPQGFGKGAADLYDMNVWSEAVVNKKESFVGDSAKWDDFKTLVDMLDKQDSDHLYVFDNFPIKAAGKERADIRMRPISSISLPSRGSDTERQFRVTFAGDKDLLDTINVTYELADGGGDIVTVEQDADDDTMFRVKARKAGETKLIIRAEGVGQSVVKITVKDPTFTKAVIWDPVHVYTGKPIKCSFVSALTNLDSYALVADFTVSYKNNTKCGRATAIIKPSAGSIYSGSVSADFKILPKKSVISKIAAGKSKVTVTVKSQRASGATKYQVAYRKKGSKKWTTKDFSIKSNKLVLKKLKKGAKYQIKVRAYAKYAGYGSYSKVSTSGKVK